MEKKKNNLKTNMKIFVSAFLLAALSYVNTAKSSLPASMIENNFLPPTKCSPPYSLKYCNHHYMSDNFNWLEINFCDSQKNFGEKLLSPLLDSSNTISKSEGNICKFQSPPQRISTNEN